MLWGSTTNSLFGPQYQKAKICSDFVRNQAKKSFRLPMYTTSKLLCSLLFSGTYILWKHIFFEMLKSLYHIVSKQQILCIYSHFDSRLFKGNKFTCNGGHSIKKDFGLLFQKRSTLKENNLLAGKQIISF